MSQVVAWVRQALVPRFCSLSIVGLGYVSLGALLGWCLWLGWWFVVFSSHLLLGTLCILHVYLVHLCFALIIYLLFLHIKKKKKRTMN